MSFLTNIQLGSNVAPGGTAFTMNRYINAAGFKLVINGTGTEIFELTTGVAGATRRFSWAVSGQYTMDAYGAGTFTGTATKWLAVTAAGIVIEEDPPTGGGVTADNGLSMSTATNVQLGQDVGAVGNPGILLNHREIPMGGFTLSLNASAAQSVNIFQTKNAATSIRARITSTASFSNTGGQTAAEVFGDGATVTGANSTVIGHNSTAATNSIVIGKDITAGTLSIIITPNTGINVSAYTQGVAVGGTLTGNSGTAIGVGTSAGISGTAVGVNSLATTSGTALGGNSLATAPQAIAIVGVSTFAGSIAIK